MSTSSEPKMVKINAGTFTMGTPVGEAGSEDNERPQHQVSVSAFYLGKYQITQKEYVAVMNFNPAGVYAPDIPVDFINWYDAVKFCNALSSLYKLTPVYTITGDAEPSDASNVVAWDRKANGYRLPTEAEWEYACRAGTTTPYYWGNSIKFLNANYNTKNDFFSQGRIAPIGSYPPNGWGLHEMLGNVFEWCWDRWSGSYLAEPQTDPIGQEGITMRVVRGGCWFIQQEGVRSGKRDHMQINVRYKGNGLRIARNG